MFKQVNNDAGVKMNQCVQYLYVGVEDGFDIVIAYQFSYRVFYKLTQVLVDMQLVLVHTIALVIHAHFVHHSV